LIILGFYVLGFSRSEFYILLVALLFKSYYSPALWRGILQSLNIYAIFAAKYMPLIVMLHKLTYLHWGRRGHDRMVVGFTTTCVISAYHH